MLALRTFSRKMAQKSVIGACLLLILFNTSNKWFTHPNLRNASNKFIEAQNTILSTTPKYFTPTCTLENRIWTESTCNVNQILPKSSIANFPSGVRIRFPGWGSAWKNPVSSNCTQFTKQIIKYECSTKYIFKCYKTCTSIKNTNTVSSI